MTDNIYEKYSDYTERYYKNNSTYQNIYKDWFKTYEKKDWVKSLKPDINSDLSMEELRKLINNMDKQKINPNDYEDFVGVVFVEAGHVCVEIDGEKHKLFSLEGDKMESLLALIAKKKLNES